MLLVLAHNFNLAEGARSLPARALGLALNSGWLGVQLFFVLSGFLITGILLDTRKAENYWSAFLARRALRIFPLYYVVLLCAFVIAPTFGRPIAGSEHQIWLWTYLANFGPIVPLLPHLWSLSVEEQFYFAWPLFVRRLSHRHLAMLCGSLVVFAIVSRVALRASSLGPEAAYSFTNARLDALALGALAALAVRDAGVTRWLLARRALLRWASLLVFVATVVTTRGAPRVGAGTQTYGYTVFAVAFAGLVFEVATARTGDAVARAFSWAPLRAAGRYSYAMYLFHMPLHLLVGLPLVERMVGQSRAATVPFALAYFVTATLLTYLAGTASYHLFEKHWLALKRHVQPRVRS